MTFTQFTAFAAVAKHLNVTKAANMLHVSQPSLSKHLKALEENFKLRLFTRHAKGIKLTDEGDEFFRDIEPILAQLDKINHRYLNGSAQKPIGPLRVGGTLWAGVANPPLSPYRLQKNSSPSRRYPASEFRRQNSPADSSW